MELETMRVVDLDDEKTWPSNLLGQLERSFGDLQGYEVERAQIDQLCREDYRARRDPPHNPYGAARKVALQYCEALLKDVALLGFHCTRLRNAEVDAIARTGLRPLDPTFLDARISECEKAGEISPAIAQRLRREHWAAQSNRVGMLWFVFTRELLTDESGVSRFFRSWGGEALYVLHERDPDTGPALRGIGRACIVEAAVPAADLRRMRFGVVAERLLTLFLSRRGVQGEHDSTFEDYTANPVDVRRVLQANGPEFASLTQCTSWRRPPR